MNKDISKHKWLKISDRGNPVESGEYLVYRAENDTQDVSYWDGKKWGYNGETDDLVTHWRELIESPKD